MATKFIPVAGGLAWRGRAPVLLANLFLDDSMFFPLTFILHPPISTQVATDLLFRVYGPLADDADLGFTSKLQFTTLEPFTTDDGDWTDLAGSTIVQATGAPVPTFIADLISTATYLRTVVTIDKFDVADKTTVRVELWANAFLINSADPENGGIPGNFDFNDMDVQKDLATDRDV